jgi:hypothetical protein
MSANNVFLTGLKARAAVPWHKHMRRFWVPLQDYKSAQG